MDKSIKYLQIYDPITNKTFQRGQIIPELSDNDCYVYMTDSTSESCVFSILPTQLSLWIGEKLTRKTITKDSSFLDSTDLSAIRFAFLKTCGITVAENFYEIYKWKN